MSYHISYRARGLGDTVYSPYLAWIAAVHAAGGVVTTLPGILAAAARYPAAVILREQFPEPDVYSRNQQYGYYVAPDDVLADISARGDLVTPTPEEQETGAHILEADWMKRLEAMVGRAGLYALLAGGLYFGWPLLARLAKARTQRPSA